MSSSSSNEKTEIVRLELHAQHLKNVAGAFNGVSDPFAIVTLLSNNPKQKPRVLGKTEVIQNTLSPRWITNFELEYGLGINSRVNIGVWDSNNKGTNKPMGSAVFEVGEVLAAKGNTKAKKLRQGGTLFVRVTPAPSKDYGKLDLGLRCVNLKNTEGLFGKSDPFLEISARIQSAGGLTWQIVYRSDHVPNNLDPEWKPFSINLDRLCAGDFHKPVQIEVFDWEKNGKHQIMGKIETSVNSLLAAQVSNGSGNPKQANLSKAFTLLRKGRESGKLVVTHAAVQGNQMQPASAGFGAALGSAPVADTPSGEMTVSERPVKISQSLLSPPMALSPTVQASPSAFSAPAAPSAPVALAPPLAPPMATAPMAPPATTPRRPKFVDYLTGGLELELSIAIDFTGSNGDPRVPGTLHYRHHDGNLNDYEKAITAVGGIIARYDSDQKFPVFGFGAKYGGVIQHCFQLGGQAEMEGITGVLQAYRTTFDTGLTMSGPTVFSEVISYTAASARSKLEMCQRTGQQCYKVLLILTDGAVTDIEDTKRAIRAASDAPLSIVIVGVGNADFSSMRHLDKFLSGAQGQTQGRDIVRFVEFSHHAHNRASLTSATLEEIPDQLVDYFFSRDIKPLAAISGSQLSLNPDEPSDEDVDLNLTFSPNGEVAFDNYTGAMYDDTQYGTSMTYNRPTPYMPSQSSQYALMQQPSQYGGISMSTPVAAPQKFHVECPPNVRAGMKLKVVHPNTQQAIVVVVPQGVGPGQKFAVQM